MMSLSFLTARLPFRPALAGLLLPLLLAACATNKTPTSPNPLPVAAAASAASAPASDGMSVAAAQSAASAPAAAEEPATNAAGVPTDPLRPDAPVNLDDEAARTDLWVRIRRGFAMPDLDNDLVHEREHWYADRPDYVQRMTERGGRYLFHVVEELDKRGMPTELALLPFIESAFNPQAMSVAKASGMWQFVPATGKHYALRQNVFRDDRRDVLASTRAALDYLQRLHDMFGDWQLALAAYNWGEGNVNRAIARNQRAGLPTDYQSLSMPAETRLYLPKLQAVKNIVSHPEAFGLNLPPLANHPYFLRVPIQRDIDVAVAVQLAEVPMEEFKTLNPSLNKPVILAAGTPQLLLPYDNASLFLRNLEEHKGPLASWTAWIVPRTMRPAAAAKQVGMSESMLREINRIPPRMLVRVGSTLLVPRSEKRAHDVSEQIADNAALSLAPDGPATRRVALRAGKADSVASIARRYHVSAAQVAQWNMMASDARFKHGQTIVVYVASRKHAGRHLASSGGAAAHTRHHASRTAAKAGNGRRARVQASAAN